MLRILAITLYSELRFRWSCTLWKVCEILYKILLKIISFDQSLRTGVTSDHQLNRCFQKSAFTVIRILIITLYSELRFWWSSTLWKAYVNLYKDIEKSMSLDQFLSTNLMHQFNRSYYFMWNFNQFSISVSSFFDSCFARALYSSLGPNMIHLKTY